MPKINFEKQPLRLLAKRTALAPNRGERDQTETGIYVCVMMALYIVDGKTICD